MVQTLLGDDPILILRFYLLVDKVVLYRLLEHRYPPILHMLPQTLCLQHMHLRFYDTHYLGENQKFDPMGVKRQRQLLYDIVACLYLALDPPNLRFTHVYER